ncbi:MAG: DUF2088 domain-containing protein [Firmicutes bacterium]|nr:DUF2088 domain-containing protein [Bacillota bacterium]
MKNFIYDNNNIGLTEDEIRQALIKSLEDWKEQNGTELKNVLIIPPDFTRFHSRAGLITNMYYHQLTAEGCNVDILPALGTHVAMTEEEVSAFCEGLPRYKRPKKIFFDRVPRNGTGKIEKVTLRERYCMGNLVEAQMK